MCGETEGAAPSGFEAAFVLDHGEGSLAGVTTSVALFPSGSAEGDILVGIELVRSDADHARTAVIVFDRHERSGAVRRGLWVLAEVVTLPAHAGQRYCLPPPFSFRFRVHRQKMETESSHV